MIGARRLLEWGDREEGRRRAARHALARIPPWLVSGLAGALLAAEILRRAGVLGEAAAAGSTAGSALGLWLAVTGAVHVLVLFGSPHRLFWRSDAAIHTRLPIAGGPLFRLALVRSARSAARASLACALGALAFGPAQGWAVTGRLIELVAICGLVAGLLGPSVALMAGAVVASDKAQALLGQLGGEFDAPRTSWLGILPGVAATALILFLIALVPWAANPASSTARPELALPAGVLIPLLATAWALRAAGRVMPAALREVSALDQVRLAHVDRSTASKLERAWFGALLGPRARHLADKDARLTRRRYPSPYFLGPLGVLVLWIIAATGSATSLPWAGAILFGIAFYAALVARRLVVAPVEIPRLLRTLPIEASEVFSAKRAAVLLRAITWPVLGGVPLALRSPDPVAAWVLVGGAALVAAVGGILAAREEV